MHGDNIMIYLPNGKLHKTRLNTDKTQEYVVNILQPHFKFDISTRLEVKADVNQFRVMEDKSVWEQSVGKRPNYFEVYWDSEWISDFDENTPNRRFVLDFFKGFHKSYEAGRIHLNTPEELQEYQTKETIEDAIRQAKKEQDQAKSEIDRLSKEVTVEVLKDKKIKKDRIIANKKLKGEL